MTGDWNVRIGNCTSGRNSKDQVNNCEEADLLDLINEFNRNILNGDTEGDWEGKHYVLLPNTIKSIQRYTAANIDNYREQINLSIYLKHENTTRDQINKKILATIPRIPVRINQEISIKLWNSGYNNARKNARASLNAARLNQRLWSYYYKAKKAYKKIVIDRKMKIYERHLQELRDITNMKDEYINKHKPRKRDPMPNKDDLHFFTLLNGSPYEPTYEVRDQRQEQQILTEEEFDTHLSNLKKKKASGNDEMMRESIIHPIHKNGSTLAAENYRGIVIGISIYK